MGKNIILTEGQQKTILELSAEGFGAKVIARKLGGVSATPIIRYLNEVGIGRIGKRGGANKTSREIQDKVVSLHAEGKTNRLIASTLGINHRTVATILTERGLVTNGTVRRQLAITTTGDAAICSKCSESLPLNQFRIQRVNSRPYVSSYCNGCRVDQIYKNLNNSSAAFIKDRHRRLQIRATAHQIPFDLIYEDLLEVYQNQGGKCFYTDVLLTLKVGSGRVPSSLSIDKVVPERGYVKGNVVLCATRINSIKYDVTLSEMEAWMPAWYQRIKEAYEDGKLW